ncbi:RING-H2 finger protein ATL72 [Morus notabilis]|uniref:RING-type E3 ubiquitin transferase n=1 Tax=Morus notabilis TaxID=981085 RepID=W9S7Q4_9ROSA|nr:RING-H2 finger protein ATL72 [Morus notabilis]EXC19533.1 RING-H2 finger protein ATL72 [Morus notabilis]
MAISTTPQHRSLLYFDKNMVIALSAFLCFVIFAVALNSILRCALRLSRRFSSADDHQQIFVIRPADNVIMFRSPRLIEHGKNIDSCSINSRVASQIPEMLYGSLEEGMRIPVTECPICLAEFEGGERVRILPGCNHGFHVECIDAWYGMGTSHLSCPICRRCLARS